MKSLSLYKKSLRNFVAARTGANGWRALCVALCLVLLAVSLSFLSKLASAQSGRGRRSANANNSNTIRPRQTVPRQTIPRATTNATPESSPGDSANTTNANSSNNAPAAGRPNANDAVATQSSGEMLDDDDEVISIASNLVPVPASVVDGQGRAVSDLQASDFELRVDGKVQPVTDISRAETPVRIALLFDNSDSLKEFREFEKEASIRFFTRVMRPVDQSAIFAICTRPVFVQPLTNNVQFLSRVIKNMDAPDCATALFDTLGQSAVYLKSQRERKVIVLLSDGIETTSNDYDFDSTMKALLEADTQVYAIRTGDIYDPKTGEAYNANVRNLIAERRLQEMTAQTGGAVYTPRTLPELEKAFDAIAADLAQQYILSYYPQEERRDGAFRQISLRVQARPNLRVRARKGYYARKG